MRCGAPVRQAVVAGHDPGARESTARPSGRTEGMEAHVQKSPMLAAAFAAVALALPVPACAATVVAPTSNPELRISWIRHGPGCKPGELAVIVSNASAHIDVILDRFRLSTPPRTGARLATTSATSAHRSCALEMKLQAGHGWRFAVTAVKAGGIAELAAGATARDVTRLSYTGMEYPVVPGAGVTGPTMHAYSYAKVLHAPPESACAGSATLTVDRRLTLTIAAGAGGTSAVEATAGPKIDLAWRQC